MEMNKALKMLETLAEKLGTTAEALWPQAVRHTLYAAVGVLVASWLVFAGFMLWFCLNIDKAVWDDTGFGGGPTQKFFALMGSVAFFVVASFVTAACVPDIVEPEGALTKEILNNISRSSGS